MSNAKHKFEDTTQMVVDETGQLLYQDKEGRQWPMDSDISRPYTKNTRKMDMAVLAIDLILSMGLFFIGLAGLIHLAYKAFTYGQP